MEVEYSRKFLKDIGGIKDNHLKDQVSDAILMFETVENLAKISNVKKLKGYLIHIDLE